MQRSPTPTPRGESPAPSPPGERRPDDDWTRQPPWCALTDRDDELARVAIRTCN